MGTSLEIFILALVAEGLTTPYDLRRAGISVGAAHPALQRLLKRKFLVKGKAGERGRSEYQLTKQGRDALHSWADLLHGYQESMPSDLESVLRVFALAWLNGKKGEALTLLQQAVAARGDRRKETQARVIGKKAPDLATFYKALIASVERGRSEGERQALRHMLAKLPRAGK